jgi:hypothetical protein
VAFRLTSGGFRRPRSKLVEAPATAAGDDLWEYQVAAWCIHPNFTPLEKVIAVPEPELLVAKPPLYIREHEVMHSELLMLCYLVDIRIIEAQDWNPRPSSSSSDDDPDDSDDSNDPDWFDTAAHHRSGPWP